MFPADTVYGLACDPTNRLAVERLYRFKRRALTKPSAVMFFDSVALDALPELGERTRAALRRAAPRRGVPAAPNPAERFPLACGEDPTTLGLRVPVIPLLADVKWPVLQSSANRAGEPERPALDRRAASRSGRPLTCCSMAGSYRARRQPWIDLRAYEDAGEWSIMRRGAVTADVVAAALRR